MPLTVEVAVWQDIVGFVQPLKSAAEATLQAHQIEHAALTIKLTDEAEMRELNRRFAGTDEPTDVLSFAAGQEAPEGEQTYLGDVAISPLIAMQSAARSGHGLTDELMVLTVHGVLHLLGYDHHEPQGKRKMWAMQSEVLQRLGIAAPE